MSKQFNQIKAYAKNKNLPLIPIKAKDISLMYEPDAFYQSILSNIRATKHRLALSALYLGTGLKEQAIVQCMLEALKSNKRLGVNIALDVNRAKRLDNHGLCSTSLLERVLSHKNVQMGLIDGNSSNSLVNKLLRRYQKWNEISSTYHAKFLIFDNSIILTGANLSEIYFDKRQDRYMMFRNCPVLSDYLFHLLDKFTTSESLSQILINHNNEFVELLSERLGDSDGNLENTDSYIIPLSQHGPSGLNDKEQFLAFLTSILPDEAQIHLSSGYFNPSPVVASMKLNSVLAPSEGANGFYGGDGLLKYVPRLYSSLYKKYLDTHANSQLHLYARPEWSFHAKGIWIKGLDDLYLHLIGSSNFNHRSSERDFETQLLLLTSNKELIDKLEDEREMLWKRSNVIQSKDITGLNFLYNLFANLFRGFL